jgi:soluble lytic murein transglycosylase-like protein
METRIKAIVLGFITGSLVVFMLATHLSKPYTVVLASAEEPLVEQVEQQEPAVIAPEEMEQECQLPASYPQSIRQWCSLIQENSAEYAVESRLIAAVMLQESGGNPDAYSKSGAVGLMQVMPRDGIAEKFQCINGPCFANRPSMQDLYNPEFNIDYGSRMLANLYARSGDWREALKSYGPMDVGYYYADIVLNIYHNYQ